VENTGIEPVTF